MITVTLSVILGGYLLGAQGELLASGDFGNGYIYMVVMNDRHVLLLKAGECTFS